MTHSASYFCFFCGKFHSDEPTKEHFIPQSFEGVPKKQWAPACKRQNAKANDQIDKHAWNIIFQASYRLKKTISQEGQALLQDGRTVPVKFKLSCADWKFQYFYDLCGRANIPPESVKSVRIKYNPSDLEQRTFMRLCVKATLGAISYKYHNQHLVVSKIFSCPVIDYMRLFMNGKVEFDPYLEVYMTVGSTLVLNRIREECREPHKMSHVVDIRFSSSGHISAKGMFFSLYSWETKIKSEIIRMDEHIRIENALGADVSPDNWKDAMYLDRGIVLENKDYAGK